MFTQAPTTLIKINAKRLYLITRQCGFTESKLKCWLNIKMNMYGFVLDIQKCNPSRQNTFAKSELKCWLNIKKKYRFLLGNK